MVEATGAVWLDEDGNDEKDSAYVYAKKLVGLSEGSFEKLLKQLEGYDQAVAIQAAGIYFRDQQKTLLLSSERISVLGASANHVQEGFKAYMDYIGSR